jgi:3-phenylpropionate/cinnamic acid dioxygenase small subunit
MHESVKTGDRRRSEQAEMSIEEPTTVDPDIYLEVQRFLYREAALLDKHEYAAWLTLAAEDIHYCVTAAVARDAAAKPVRYSIIEESFSGLKARVQQISNPKLTLAENPPSFTRRFVSNIEAYHTALADELMVTSYLLARRMRPSEPEGGFYVAERNDVLRRDGSSFRLARRTVHLDQTTLFGGALSALL